MVSRSLTENRALQGDGCFLSIQKTKDSSFFWFKRTYALGGKLLEMIKRLSYGKDEFFVL